MPRDAAGVDEEEPGSLGCWGNVALAYGDQEASETKKLLAGQAKMSSLLLTLTPIPTHPTSHIHFFTFEITSSLFHIT